MIIGIGGISRSGKTKLAKRLKTYFKKQYKLVSLFSMDNFMYSHDKLPLTKNYVNREVPEAINFEKLIEQLKVAKPIPNSIVIVEGHLVFAKPNLDELLDCRIFFNIDKATFIERKVKDGRWGKLPDWYIDYCWQAWLQYGQICEKRVHLSLDGNRKLPFECVLDYIYRYEKKA